MLSTIQVGITQRLGNQQQEQPQKKPVIITQARQIKQETQAKTNTQPTTVKKNLPNKNLATAAAKKIIAKSKPNARQANIAQQRQKGNILQRLGNRGNFQRLPFNRPQQGMRPSPSPRFNGPRPFLEHRMRFPGPINDMRLPGPPFRDQGPPPFGRRPPPFEDQGPPPFERRPFEDQGPPPFKRRPFDDQGPPPFEHRPFEDQGPPPFRDQRPLPFENQRTALLSFHPPGDRPPFDQFMFEEDRPHFRRHPMRMDFPDRFPRPQFQNQMMRPQIFEPNSGPMFQRPRFQGPNQQRQRFNKNQQKKTGIGIKSSPGKTTPSPTKSAVIKKEEIQDDGANTQNSYQQIVSNVSK